MTEDAFIIPTWPSSRAEGLLIAGFDGWGNALNVSRAMAAFLAQRMPGKEFGRIRSDLFYRYDESRPRVRIQDGRLEEVSPPGGTLYLATAGKPPRDVVILKADERHLRWMLFAEALLDLCERLKVTTLITLGSMYDQVLHTERIISAVASSEETLAHLASLNVLAVNYEGPSAIHSLIQEQGQHRGLTCISLWCHCPYYLQGTTHFGLLSQLGSLIATLGGFDLDSSDLETAWKELSRQIQALIAKNPELEATVRELRKDKVRGSWESMKASIRKSDKVIDLTDFFNLK